MRRLDLICPGRLAHSLDSSMPLQGDFDYRLCALVQIVKTPASFSAGMLLVLKLTPRPM